LITEGVESGTKSLMLRIRLADRGGVSTSLHSALRSRRLMSSTAAAMFGGAAMVAVVEGFIPGAPRVGIAPGLVALGIAGALLVSGARTPRWVLALLGPFGVALIAVSLSAESGPGDGAMLYIWPVLWTAYFYGRRGAIWIVGCIAVGHGFAVVMVAHGETNISRWLDVVVSVAVVAAVVQFMSRRNEELLARVSAEARTDTLTRLLNRRGFDERAAVILAHAARTGDCVAAASFDLDFFKKINDDWGHDVGDRVLADFGALLSVQSRGIDAVARVGGEEFVVLLPGCDVREAEAFTRRIRTELAARQGDGPTVRVSAGVAAATRPTSMPLLLRNADAALYAAKRSGRNRTIAFGRVPSGDPAVDPAAEPPSPPELRAS
jgi:diguanylate cyclase (GGDEF)-like protein